MNFFGWEKAQQGQKYQTRPGRARVEEQELETALPQPPMASGVQFPFQLIMPYGRRPKERVLQSLNELDAKDRTVGKATFSTGVLRGTHWRMLWGMAKAKEGSGSQAAHSEGASTSILGQQWLLGAGETPQHWGVLTFPWRWSCSAADLALPPPSHRCPQSAVSVLQRPPGQ